MNHPDNIAEKAGSSILAIDTVHPQEPLGDLFGIFFEDINHAADGGLYAEMVQNRSFEFEKIDNPKYHPLYAWEKVEEGAQVQLEIETAQPYHANSPHYLVMETKGNGRAGIANLGFGEGFYLEKGETYLFTCYARALEEQECVLSVSVEEKDCCALASIPVRSPKWEKYELRLTAEQTTTAGRLLLTLSEAGRLALDYVSLFPEKTFLGRKNGLRRDIAQLLCDMKPKFMRFPGGCLVHDGSLNPLDRDSMYRWKNTLGEPENRPARRSNWGYNQTLGLGYYEYFQFCEDIGAKPLPVLPGGYDPHHQRMVPLDEMGPWIQDALDLIEFANGGTDTEWGSFRASLGHPAPFGLEYLGIGNEEVGDAFFERYELIHRAVREKYPEIKLINTASPFAAGTEYERGWRSARKNGSDLIDEHYYMAPEWFLANHHRYDSFPKDGPKVFLGEYASWGNTWYNALVEASYMTALERNAASVGLACYAPMLANASYVNWKPDMVWFDNHRAFGTPNYYVQKLFMNHQGSRRLSVSAEGIGVVSSMAPEYKGKIRLEGYETDSRFEEVSVRNLDTEEVLAFGDFLTEKGEHAWLERCADGAEHEGYEDWENYEISLKACELDGWKGFQILFGWKDDENYLAATFGGWQNLDLFIHRQVKGRGCDLTEGWFQAEKGRVYDLKIRVKDCRITVFIDGEEYLAVTENPVEVERLYYAASLDETDGSVILKVVNLQEGEETAQIRLEGWKEDDDRNGSGGEKTPAARKFPVTAQIFTMTGKPEQENSFDQPTAVSPAESSISLESESFSYVFPALSLTVFRIPQAGTEHLK